MTSDPIGLNGSLNTYGYVSSNPLVNIDPYGLVELGGPASVGFSITAPTPIPLVSVSFGGGLVMRQCCGDDNKKYNEIIFSSRFGLGTGASIQASASGRGIVPIIRSDKLPKCVSYSEELITRALGKVDVTFGPLSGKVDLNSGANSLGLSFGAGFSAVAQLIRGRFSIYRGEPIGDCKCE